VPVLNSGKKEVPLWYTGIYRQISRTVIVKIKRDKQGNVINIVVSENKNVIQERR
jgi:hypothetical protein